MKIAKVQEASAQLDTSNAFFASPGTSDFLSLALAIMPTVPGADLNVSDVTGSTDCDLLVPITYVDAGCMTSLPLPTPITYQPNTTLPVNNAIYYTDYNLSSTLAVSIRLSSDNITAGEIQTVTVTVSDENSTAPVSGAVVNSNITNSYGTGAYEYAGTTDEFGQTTFDYAIPVNALSDFYDVTVYASADGYDNATSSTIFEVIGSDYDDFYDNSTSDDYNYDDNYDYDDGSSDDCCDYDSPTVKSTDADHNENNVNLDTNIKVTFDEKIDEDSVDESSLFLDGDFNDPNVRDVSVSSKSATFTLDDPLFPGSDYVAQISSSIQDEDGNYLDCYESDGVNDNCEWNFSTADDNTNPSVESTSPADKATGVSLGSSITATFSEPMEVASVLASFTVKDGVGNIPGTIQESNLFRTYTFTPTSLLSSSTSYTVTITTGANDLAGNACPKRSLTN